MTASSLTSAAVSTLLLRYPSYFVSIGGNNKVYIKLFPWFVGSLHLVTIYITYIESLTSVIDTIYPKVTLILDPLDEWQKTCTLLVEPFICKMLMCSCKFCIGMSLQDSWSLVPCLVSPHLMQELPGLKFDSCLLCNLIPTWCLWSLKCCCTGLHVYWLLCMMDMWLVAREDLPFLPFILGRRLTLWHLSWLTWAYTLLIVLSMCLVLVKILLINLTICLMLAAVQSIEDSLKHFTRKSGYCIPQACSHFHWGNCIVQVHFTPCFIKHYHFCLIMKSLSIHIWHGIYWFVTCKTFPTCAKIQLMPLLLVAGTRLVASDHWKSALHFLGSSRLQALPLVLSHIWASRL